MCVTCETIANYSLCDSVTNIPRSTIFIHVLAFVGGSTCRFPGAKFSRRRIMFVTNRASCVYYAGHVTHSVLPIRNRSVVWKTLGIW